MDIKLIVSDIDGTLVTGNVAAMAAPVKPNKLQIPCMRPQNSSLNHAVKNSANKTIPPAAKAERQKEVERHTWGCMTMNPMMHAARALRTYARRRPKKESSAQEAIMQARKDEGDAPVMSTNRMQNRTCRITKAERGHRRRPRRRASAPTAMLT